MIGALCTEECVGGHVVALRVVVVGAEHGVVVADGGAEVGGGVVVVDRHKGAVLRVTRELRGPGRINGNWNMLPLIT